ncbi:MAG: ATP-dependent zinc protease [Candidatus Microsaccharimonas sossegonensis]|uniref:ATP-dependent zinc protease n=1 Tax=Candidatus Microsaccharimonas sossegonensis TaxID=2506948 RepID=A0A4Q0AGX6_9BACT|nr:MAG: ATP-dependent zinc protease [Candidatus Microsaccharimonas sossegonensis]
MSKKLDIIGRNIMIDIIGHIKGVPAKVDTGADSSAIWASNITVNKEGALQFTLFAEGSKYYTGEVIKRKAFRAAAVRSSNGHEQIRYRVEMPVKIAERRLRVGFYLSDRTLNDFPILLGRRLLNKKFLVDVSVKEYRPKPKEKRGIYEEMIKDPYAFHKKYYQNDK